MRRRWSLAGQILALQLAVVFVLLLIVGAVLLATSDADFRDVEGRRVLAIGEAVAAESTVRFAVDGAGDKADVLAPIAERERVRSGASWVEITDANRTVLTSPDPGRIRTALRLEESVVLEGRAWTGVTDDPVRAVVAHVPVLSAERGQVGRLLGIVSVGRAYPTLGERLEAAAPDLLTYLGLASLLGVAGSLLLARRVKRQTLGLEPREITGLVEHREAMLRGIKEGVVGVDSAHRVTVVNDEARALLGLPADAVGRPVRELGLEPWLVEALAGPAPARDQVAVIGERLLTLNRMPVVLHDRPVGSVTTMRDLTELNVLQRELGATRQATDALRAQAHEFANRLHTISGLVELGEHAEVVRYIERVGRGSTQLAAAVTERIADPSLAALLIAKASLAAERGVELKLSPTTRLGPVDDELSEDLCVVVGNLVNNALDAVASETSGAAAGTITVEIAEASGIVCVAVRDSGPGVAPELVDEVFRRGFSTKPATSGARGFGLALTQSICTRRGGGVSVVTDGPPAPSTADTTAPGAGGAIFAARLPRARQQVS